MTMAMQGTKLFQDAGTPAHYDPLLGVAIARLRRSAMDATSNATAARVSDEALYTRLIEDATLRVPTLDPARINAEGGAVTLADGTIGVRFAKTIAYQGDATLFDCQPAGLCLEAPCAVVDRDRVHIAVVTSFARFAEAMEAIDFAIYRVRKILEWQRHDARAVNDMLPIWAHEIATSASYGRPSTLSQFARIAASLAQGGGRIEGRAVFV